MKQEEFEIEMTCGVTVMVRAEYLMINGEPEIEAVYQVKTGEYLTLVASDEDKVLDAITSREH